MTTSAPARTRTTNDWRSRDAAPWLALAASPTFALMACITTGDAASFALCASATSLHRMTAMYTLMSLFHLAPWLKLASPRRWTRP